jgi:glycosyltransferase involved in cell wall biosynthesis
MVQQYRIQNRRQQMLRRYRAVLVASEHMRSEIARHGVDERRLYRVPLFPPAQWPLPAPPEPRPFSDRVLFVGRLTNLKGVDLLIRALPLASQKLERSLTLVVAGTGPDQSRLEQLAQTLRVPAEFHGWVGPEQRAELMQVADVVAVPSVWPEPFGLVGIEAGCVGLPAVAFALGGIPDWLVPGQTGEFAGDEPSASGLADALVRALRDRDHWQELRRGAWERARRFDRETHLARLEAIFNQVATKDLATVGASDL